MTAGNPDTYGSARQRWLALVVLSASLLVITMDMTILHLALPGMAADLHPNSAEQLWIVDIYSLVLAGLLVPVAAIADRWGRRRMLVLGYAMFGIASLLVLVANTAVEVIAIRGLLGIGGAMIMPTTLSLIRVIFTDPRERATALSIWAAISGLGAVIGPLVGGFLLEHFSWHAAFLVNVPPMLAGMLAAMLLLRESRVAGAGPWDVVAALLSLTGMTSLIWALKEFGKQSSLAVPLAWAGLALAALLLTWFAIRCWNSDHPLLELRLFRNRQFSAGITAAISATFALIAALLLLAQWLQMVNGASPIKAGLQLMPVALTGSVFSLAAPPLSRALGSRVVLAGGLAVAGLGLILIGAAGDGLDLTWTMIALCLIGAGIGSLAIASAMIMGGTPADKAGSAGALEETAYELGATLGVTILGSISAVIFRARMGDSPELAALAKLDSGLAGQVKESIGAAMAIAEEAGIDRLASLAGGAFTDSLQTTGFIGGVIMIAVAGVVFLMTPKGTEATASATDTSPP